MKAVLVFAFLMSAALSAKVQVIIFRMSLTPEPKCQQRWFYSKVTIKDGIRVEPRNLRYELTLAERIQMHLLKNDDFVPEGRALFQKVFNT